MISIFTDGSVSRPREGRSPGGWAYTFCIGDERYSKFGSYLATTNNRMELTAAIKALKRLHQLGYGGQEVNVTSDSQYVILGASTYLAAWKRTGRLRNNRSSLKNKDLWLQIDELTTQFKTRWLWVKGHRGHPENELCDHLAALGSQRAVTIERSLVLPLS